MISYRRSTSGRAPTPELSRPSVLCNTAIIPKQSLRSKPGLKNGCPWETAVAVHNIPEGVIGFIVGGTAGLMIYITADEFIPYSYAGTNHRTLFSLITGVVFVILPGVI